MDGYNTLIALLPGVLVTYNGEEIGQENGEVPYELCKDPSACDLGEDYFLQNSRDFARTPFHWDNTTNAGFNDGATPWLPVSDKYFENNLYYQTESERSHYRNYQELLQLRKDPTIVSGKLKYVAFSDNVLGITRTSSNGGNNYAFVFNINGVSETVDLTLGFPAISSELEVAIASVGSERHVG